MPDTAVLHKIELSYALTARDSDSASLRNPLIDLLHAVRERGSISAAAQALDLSYRHVWGELKRWEEQLGRTLIVWEKGQPARLTEFGNKLLWAERQAQARLSPQIEALRADLERAFAVAFDDTAHVLTLYASHDDALAPCATHAAANAPVAPGRPLYRQRGRDPRAQRRPLRDGRLSHRRSCRRRHAGGAHLQAAAASRVCTR